MAFEFVDSGWFPTINFLKKSNNWVEILEEAAENVIEEIRDDAEQILYSKVKRNTGSVGESIFTYSEVIGDKVSLGLESEHPAASIIEYGGYSPFPPWGSSSGLPFPVAKKIYENQPFAQPRPFLRPALTNGIDDINSEIMAVAKSKLP
tara:strand:- start:35 stop:481 length:447 start_codon:yes stop_codon:yes gene_type:complete